MFTHSEDGINIRRAVVALDQSTRMVGWAIFLENGKNWRIESWGNHKPDPPDYDTLRVWLRDTIGTLQAQGYDVHVPIETVYVGPNRNVSLILSHCQGYFHAIVREMSATYAEVTPAQSLKEMTGITARLKREQRKEAMCRVALEVLGESVTDDIADAVGIGKAYISQLGNGASV